MDEFQLYKKLWQFQKNISSVQKDVIESLIKENTRLKKELYKEDYGKFTYVDPDTGQLKPHDFPEDHNWCGCADCGDCECAKCNPMIPLP